MSLHHLVHLCVSSSYLMANIVPVGIFIGFIHDVSDILISASKGFHLSGYENTSVVVFIGAMIGWFTMRLMALPKIILFLTGLVYAEDRTYLQPYMTISWSLLCFLLFLFHPLVEKILFLVYFLFHQVSIISWHGRHESKRERSICLSDSKLIENVIDSFFGG